MTSGHLVRRAFRYELKLFGVQSVFRLGWLQAKYNFFNKLLVLGIFKNSCVTAVVELSRDQRLQNIFGCGVLFLISKQFCAPHMPTVTF
jgi:hypothetical protein